MKRLLTFLLALVLLPYMPVAALAELASGPEASKSPSAEFAGMQWICHTDGTLVYSSGGGMEKTLYTDVATDTLQFAAAGDLTCWLNTSGQLMLITQDAPFHLVELGTVRDYAIGFNEETLSSVLLYADAKGTLAAYPKEALKKAAGIQKKAETIYYNPDSKLFFWIVPGKKDVCSIFGAFASNLNQPFYMGKNVVPVRKPDKKAYGAGLFLSTNTKAGLLFGIVLGLPRVLAEKPDWVRQENDNYALFKTNGAVYAVVNHFYNEEVLQFVTDQDIPPEGFTLSEDSVTWDGGVWDAKSFTTEGIAKMEGLLGWFEVIKDSGQIPWVTLPAPKP